MKNDEILTKKEAMEFLKIGSSTLQKLINEKQITYVKLERKVLFYKTDLDVFLKSRLIRKKK